MDDRERQATKQPVNKHLFHTFIECLEQTESIGRYEM